MSNKREGFCDTCNKETDFYLNGETWECQCCDNSKDDYLDYDLPYFWV